MHGYSKHLKLVSSLLLQAFVLQQIAYAAPEIKPIEFRLHEEKLKVNFSLPASIATIEGSWKSPEKNSKTLILLQDAHTNDSGQINLAKTLDIILKSQPADSPQYVFTEGALGNNSLSDLREKASLAKREEVAMSYIKKGLLHGAEYLDLTSEHNFVLWGVENRDQYVASLEAYKKVAANREKFQAYLSTIDQTIETLKLQILNPALYKFNKDYESFKDEKIVLTDYLDTLTAQAKALNLSLDSMPHLKSLKTLKDKESQINFKKATDEEIEAVASLVKEEQEELKNLAETLERSPFKIGSQEKNEDKAFYVVLEDVITRSAKQSNKSYSELQKYFEYLKVAKTIDLKAALKEIDALEEKIFSGLSLSQNEKNLILCEKTVYYLHKLFDLKLTPEDYERYQVITREFPITELTGFLNKQIMERKKYYERAIFLEEGYEEIVAQSEKFYELTSERDEHFITEALNKMDAENQNQAVLITGGFHEANLKSLLKSKNISYVSIVPQIFHETNQKRYENILLNQTKLTFNPKPAQITQSTIITPSAGSDGVAFPAIWVNGLVLRDGIYADINPSFQPSFPAPSTPDRRSTTLPTTPRIPAPTQVPVKQAVGSRLAVEREKIEFPSWGIAINLEKQVGLYPQGDSYGPANVDTSKAFVLATIEVLHRTPSAKAYSTVERFHLNRPMDETAQGFKAWLETEVLSKFVGSGHSYLSDIGGFLQNLRSGLQKSGSRLVIQPEETSVSLRSGTRLALPAVNPRTTSAWIELQRLFDNQRSEKLNLRVLFEQDSARVADLTHSFSSGAARIDVDFSKNLVNQEILDELLALADQTELPLAINQMFAGERINETEDRAVLHTALRAPRTSAIPVSGGSSNVVPDVHKVLGQMRKFSENINSGRWTGYTGKQITDVVNIGIGGSDLGPVMVTEALKPYATKKVNVHFVSNVDGTDIAEKVFKKLDPETTLFIIASKTFTTQETMTNAESAREWFLKSAKNQEAVKQHFVAISTNKSAVEKFGIDPANMFEFWDWVGGRYSLWSAIGLSISTYIGFDNFQELLAGAHDMDNHFRTTPLNENIPVILALLSIWYTNFYGAESHAILPYDQYLHRLPAYLQQAFMESNGKGTDRNGNPINYIASPTIFGEPGTNGQHSFYQLFHQGYQMVPSDFIGVTNSQNPISDHQDKLLANMLAQTQALAFGKTLDEVLAEGVDAKIAPHRTFPGNNPTTSILINRLTPRALGALVAMYEHQIFAEGIILNVYSFDQWGVELGKVKTAPILNQLKGVREPSQNQDASTQNLLRIINNQRTSRTRLPSLTLEEQAKQVIEINGRKGLDLEDWEIARFRIFMQELRYSEREFLEKVLPDNIDFKKLTRIANNPERHLGEIISIAVSFRAATQARWSNEKNARHYNEEPFWVDANDLEERLDEEVGQANIEAVFNAKRTIPVYVVDYDRPRTGGLVKGPELTVGDIDHDTDDFSPEFKRKLKLITKRIIKNRKGYEYSVTTGRGPETLPDAVYVTARKKSSGARLGQGMQSPAGSIGLTQWLRRSVYVLVVILASVNPVVAEVVRFVWSKAEERVRVQVDGKLISPQDLNGLVYQPTEGNRHISSYTEGNMAELIAPLLPANDPVLKELGLSERGRNDAKTLAELGAKNIRLYYLPLESKEDIENVKKILRRAYELYGIRVMAGHWAGFWELSGSPMLTENVEQQKEAVLASVKQMVQLYANEPWLLFWQIGNEMNYHVKNGRFDWKVFPMSLEEYYSYMAELGFEIKKTERTVLDENSKPVQHPVLLNNGSLSERETEILSNLFKKDPKNKPFDGLGINFYPGVNFEGQNKGFTGDVSEVDEVFKRARRLAMPVAIAETGVWAYTPEDLAAVNMFAALKPEFDKQKWLVGWYGFEAQDEEWKVRESGRREEGHFGVFGKMWQKLGGFKMDISRIPTEEEKPAVEEEPEMPAEPLEERKLQQISGEDVWKKGRYNEGEGNNWRAQWREFSKPHTLAAGEYEVTLSLLNGDAVAIQLLPAEGDENTFRDAIILRSVGGDDKKARFKVPFEIKISRFVIHYGQTVAGRELNENNQTRLSVDSVEFVGSAESKPESKKTDAGNYTELTGESNNWTDGRAFSSYLDGRFDFTRVEKLRLTLRGKEGTKFQVRLLPEGASPDQPRGLLPDVFELPKNGVLVISIPEDYRAELRQISVHSGSKAWESFGQDRSATVNISKIEIQKPSGARLTETTKLPEVGVSGTRLAKWHPLQNKDIPHDFARALHQNGLDLTVDSIRVKRLVGADSVTKIFEGSQHQLIIETSLAQALGSILFAGHTKEAKEVADANAVYLGYVSLIDYTRRHANEAIVIMGDEGARDNSTSLPMGAIFYKGQVISYEGLSELKHKVKKLREENVTIRFQVADALEKTNGLVIPEALTDTTDSTSLIGLFDDWKEYLLNDSLRIGGISFNSAQTIELDPFDLPSTALRKIAISEGILPDSKAFRQFMNSATILTLGPRAKELEKEGYTGVQHRHREIILDAQQLTQAYPRLKVVLPGDGDALPRIIATSGVGLDGKRLFVFGRSGMQEGTASTIAANTLGGQFALTLSAPTATNKDFSRDSVYQYSPDEQAAIAEAGMQFHDAQRTLYKQDRIASGLIAVTSVTGSSEEIFGRSFASDMQRVIFTSENGDVLALEDLTKGKLPQRGFVITNTLFINRTGSVVVIRTRLRSNNLPRTIYKLQRISPEAEAYFNQNGEAKGSRLSSYSNDGVKLALEPERWAWLRTQTEGADAKLSAAAIRNIEAWWNSAAVNSDQRETLTRLIDEKAVNEIRAGFESEKDILEPGTAGTRGEMENLKAVEVKDLKVGVNYVSTTMVIRYANAFARRYHETNQKGPVFITKEVRDNSDSYADVAAKILISNGIPVIRVPNAVSTPLASYLARWLKQNEVEAAFGFQISASHNAWSNNGIKFMGSDGQQLMPDDMAEIMKRIPKLDATPAVPDLDLRSNLLYEEISQKKFEEILEAYFDAIDNTLTPDFKNLIQEAFKNKSNRFVFTALNGASGSETKLYLSRLGLEEGRDYFIVEEEMIPPSEIKDSELKEEVLGRKNSDPAATGLLNRAQALADQENVNFVIARDPDGDRFVASIRAASGWEKLNGNENGLLMEEDRLSHASKEDQANSVYVRSHATSSEADEVVKAFGGKVIITPVGFKYPGAILGLLGNMGRRFFAHEESYGTGNGQIAEKDGLSGLANFLIILSHLKENESVFDKLESIRMQYGFKGDAIQNYEIPGSDKASRDAAKARVIQKFDDLKVGETLGSFVITDKITEIKTPVGDFTDGYIFILEDQAANRKFQLVFRASGTEPIFKAYFSLVEGVKSKDPADFKTKSKEVLDYSKNTVFPKVGEALASFAGSRLAKKSFEKKFKGVRDWNLDQFVSNAKEFTGADSVEIVDVSDDERLIEEAIRAGEIVRTGDGNFYARSHPKDTARAEDRTFVATSDPKDKGFYNNWIQSDKLKSRLGKKVENSLKGKKIYVIPYLMGPEDSPYSQVGVEITDSRFVALNMIRMAKVGKIALDRLGENPTNFVKGLHVTGDLDTIRRASKPGEEDDRYFAIFPDEKFIVSYGSAYGGNALLAKKFHALRQASYDALKEGWLAEHMLIVGIQDTETNETHYVAAAFPSASGKTNLSMLIPPQFLQKRYRVWLEGDDIAWLRIGPDGRLYAFNPENGFFGVAPGTNYETNPNAMEAIGKNTKTIFTNVAFNEETGEVWWEGKTDSYPSNITGWRDWQGKLISDRDPADQKNKKTTWAHPNSRFTSAIENAPNWIGHAKNLKENERPANWNNPIGRPISAIFFGGRVETGEPLIRQLKSAEEGVYDGGMMGVLTTAAAENVDPFRRDPMAMRPFFSYNENIYFNHWLNVMQKLGDKAPAFFHVNWFRKDENGKFLWPGFGENLRPILWAIDRAKGAADAIETPIGYLPTQQSFNLEELSFTTDQWYELLNVDIPFWFNEANARDRYITSFGDDLPLLFADAQQSFKLSLGLYKAEEAKLQSIRDINTLQLALDIANNRVTDVPEEQEQSLMRLENLAGNKRGDTLRTYLRNISPLIYSRTKELELAGSRLAVTQLVLGKNLQIVEPNQFASYSASQIADDILRGQEDPNKIVNVVFATGNTMVKVLHELSQIKGIDWNRVRAFHQDEYLNLATNHPSSYAVYMKENLFDKVGIPAENIFYVDGQNPAYLNPDTVNAYYERIEELGGVDIEIHGIGPDGHVAFAEPPLYSKRDQVMQIAKLDKTTIEANRPTFPDIAPDQKAITFGMANVLKARKIYLLISGEKKAEIANKALTGPITEDIPASLLRELPEGRVTYILDTEAASRLTLSKQKGASSAKYIPSAAQLTPDQALKQIAELKAVAVIPIGVGLEKAINLGRTAIQNNIGAEITFRGKADDVVTALKQLRSEFPDKVLAAGTVNTVEQVELAYTAGANVVVSPGTDPSVIRRAIELGMLPVPGVSDPEEARIALASGAQVLKYFPPSLSGVQNYIEEMRGPLADLAPEFNQAIALRKIRFEEFDLNQENLPLVNQVASFSRIKEHLLFGDLSTEKVFYLPTQWGLDGYLGQIIEQNPSVPVIVTAGQMPTSQMQEIKNSHPTILNVGVVLSDESVILDIAKNVSVKPANVGSRLAQFTVSRSQLRDKLIEILKDRKNYVWQGEEDAIIRDGYIRLLYNDEEVDFIQNWQFRDLEVPTHPIDRLIEEKINTRSRRFKILIVRDSVTAGSGYNLRVRVGLNITVVNLDVPRIKNSGTRLASGQNVQIFAQRITPTEGAQTGQLSLATAIRNGANGILVGHSEVRPGSPTAINDNLFNTFEQLKAAAVRPEIQTLALLVGETTKDEASRNKTIASQLTAALKGIPSSQLEGRLVIGYEPRWAIAGSGQGEAATPEYVESAHREIRRVLGALYGPKFADSTRIIYGGSANASNAASFLALDDVDGLLVGGASKAPDSFEPLVQIAATLSEGKVNRTGRKPIIIGNQKTYPLSAEPSQFYEALSGFDSRFVDIGIAPQISDIVLWKQAKSGTRLATVRRTVDRTTTLGRILADIFDEYDLRKEQIAIITVTDSRDGDREVSIEDTDRDIYPGDTVVVEYNQGSRLVASVPTDTILAESIGTQDFRSPELVARLSDNRLERIRAALEKPFDESRVSQKGKLNPEETITFVANVVRTTGKVGLLALGSALLQIQFGGDDEDNELVIYGLGEPIRIDNYKLVATENKDVYQVTVSTQDIKLALERVNAATYALDQAPESFYIKPVLLNAPVEVWLNEDTLEAKDFLIPILLAYFKAVHQHKYGKNAGIVLQGDPEIVAEILARADQYFESEERFVFSEDDTLPEFLKNAAHVNLIAVREDSTSPIPAENENERNLPAEALGKNEVPNMKSLKLALFEGRIEELEANDPEFRTFLGVYKELLGQDIKDLNEFIQVLEGKLTVLNALKRFALPPVMKLAVDSMIQVYEMMKRMAEQAA